MSAATKGRVDLDQTRQSLEQLGLMHASEQLSELVGQAVKKNLSVHRFLDELLWSELAHREERRIKTSLRLSGLPPGQTLGNFDFNFQPAIRKSRATATVDEQAFEQVVSRFERFLQLVGTSGDRQNFGLLIHDNNETVARKHTELMKRFHKAGTLWTRLNNIIETPLFVDSELTRMVQIADLCAYAMRRYLENQETELFNLIFERADRKDGLVVGVRHFTGSKCTCLICGTHSY